MTNINVDRNTTFKILKLLSIPFNQWNAYKFGIINENGKIIKSREEFNTPDEYMSFTFLEEVIIKIKENTEKLPYESMIYKKSVAATWLIKECGSIPDLYDLQDIDLSENFSRFLPLLKEEMIGVGSGAIAGVGVGPQGEPGLTKTQQNWYTWNNSRVYVVSTNNFMNARNTKNPYHRYSKYVGEDETGKEIRDYGRSNPKANIILQDRQTGAMIYLRKNNTK